MLNVFSELYQKQAATRQQYDAVIAKTQTADALVKQAAESAKQAQVMLAEAVLYAPFSGVVGERLQEPGDMGMASQPLLTLLKPNDLRLEAAISATCAQSLRLGDSVPVRIDGLAQGLTGEIDEIAPETNPETRSQLIKLRLPQTDNLQQGRLGWVELACQAQQAVLLIPEQAIIHYGQLQAVKRIDGKHWFVRHIRTGKHYGEQVEVLSGLQDGDVIWLNSGLTQ
ncbi:efflux RND transporter periplasmic adaptor subunit [Methylocucumis oryzae]|uniref:efflux RND transporter periplasmic adaptor subunit n=1 Tax=Methylocucumis oryzae TaxID=1632867 RepID=UPI000ACF8C65|nr:efflux RND transporter periplasmic adaptor subunit [Methylocucumis oryzae]